MFKNFLKLSKSSKAPSSIKIFNRANTSLSIELNNNNNNSSMPDFNYKLNSMRDMWDSIKQLRSEFYEALNADYQEGVKAYKDGDNNKALISFNKIIKLGEEKIEDFTKKERIIIADANAYTADIIRYKSLESENEALKYIEKSLEICPESYFAKKIENEILSERGTLKIANKN